MVGICSFKHSYWNYILPSKFRPQKLTTSLSCRAYEVSHISRDLLTVRPLQEYNNLMTFHHPIVHVISSNHLKFSHYLIINMMNFEVITSQPTRSLNVHFSFFDFLTTWMWSSDCFSTTPQKQSCVISWKHFRTISQYFKKHLNKCFTSDELQELIAQDKFPYSA